MLVEADVPIKTRRRLTHEQLERLAGSTSPAKPLAVNQVHRMLRSPYYRGVVVWQGVEYPGRHRALVDEQTWYRVQEVLVLKRKG